MARPLRVLVPGGWYHVVNRGQRRERIFVDDEDRRRFCRLLAELRERFRVEVHAFVLMDNHYHLLVRPREANLSRAMQWLQLTYCVRFNWSHQTTGHLFQGRFKTVHIQKESDLAEVARYLHLNPVRVAGLGLGKSDRQRTRVAGMPDPGEDRVAERLRVLDAHAWSSWRVYGCGDPVPEWLDTDVVWPATGGKNRRQWVAAIRKYTEEPVRQGGVEDPWDRVVGGMVLGDPDYAQGLLADAKADLGSPRNGKGAVPGDRIEWETLVGWAEAERGAKWNEVLERYGDWTRDAVLFAAVRYGGYRLSEVYGRIPGLKYQAAAQAMRRIEARRRDDGEVGKFIRRLEGQMSNV